MGRKTHQQGEREIAINKIFIVVTSKYSSWWKFVEVTRKSNACYWL